MDILCVKQNQNTGDTEEKCLNIWSAFVRKSKELFSVTAGKVTNNKLELWQRILVLGTILWGATFFLGSVIGDRDHTPPQTHVTTESFTGQTGQTYFLQGVWNTLV